MQPTSAIERRSSENAVAWSNYQAIAWVLATACALASPASQAADLVGTFYRPNGTSSALFALANGQQRLVANGRMVDASTQLVEVKANSVVIEANGQRQRLTLAGSVSTASDKGPVTTSVRQAPAPILSREESAKRRQIAAARSKDNRLAMLIGLKPISDGSSQMGYEAGEASQLAFFSTAGVRPSDVIVAVNGTAFQREEDIEDLAYEMDAFTKYSVTVERGGKRQVLQVGY